MGKYTAIANDIAYSLENASFDVTDNSGYYTLTQYETPDGDTVALAVCVNKEEDEGREYYAVYSIVDVNSGVELTDAQWDYTDTLSVKELEKVLEELASYYPPEVLESLYNDDVEDIVSSTKIKCDTNFFAFDINECTTQSEIEGLGSALTFEGFDLDGGDLEFLVNWLNDHGCELKRQEVYLIKGATMNEIYGLTGNNRYPDDLNIVSIPLDNITNLMNIITARFAIGGRWLDDVIENNVRREEEKHYNDDGDDYYM